MKKKNRKLFNFFADLGEKLWPTWLFEKKKKKEFRYYYYVEVSDIYDLPKFCTRCGTPLEKNGGMKVYDCETGKPVWVPYLYCPRESDNPFRHAYETKDCKSGYWKEVK